MEHHSQPQVVESVNLEPTEEEILQNQLERINLTSPAPVGNPDDSSAPVSFQRFPKLSMMHALSSKYKLRLKISDTDMSVLTSLRRIMLAEVPTVAIDSVGIRFNSSVLTDEYIAHRLGLIPLTSHAAMAMLLPSECTCGNGCESCSVTLTLSVKATSDGVTVVTTQDLVSSSEHLVAPVMVDVDRVVRGGEIPTSNIVIAKLKKGQELDIIATAKKGVGAMHAKWSPVSAVSVFKQPEIWINDNVVENLTLAERQAWVESSPIIPSNPPTRVLKLDPATNMVVVHDTGVFTYEELHGHFEEAEKDGLLYLFEHEHDDMFIMTVESTGVLPAAQIFLNAIDIMKQKLDGVRFVEVEAAVPAADDSSSFEGNTSGNTPGDMWNDEAADGSFSLEGNTTEGMWNFEAPNDSATLEGNTIEDVSNDEAVDDSFPLEGNTIADMPNVEAADDSASLEDNTIADMPNVEAVDDSFPLEGNTIADMPNVEAADDSFSFEGTSSEDMSDDEATAASGDDGDEATAASGDDGDEATVASGDDGD